MMRSPAQAQRANPPRLLRSGDGVSTLLCWGHGRRRKNLRRLLAALRMSAALAADRRRDGSPKGGDLSLTPIKPSHTLKAKA